MKIFLRVFVVVTTMTIVCFSLTKWSSQRWAIYASTNDIISVFFNDNKITFTDQGPIIVDGIILMPVRYVFEAMGFNVLWDNENRQAVLTKGEDIILVKIGSDIFSINGENYNLDASARLIGGRVMLPLDTILKSVGYELICDASTMVVSITPMLNRPSTGYDNNSNPDNNASNLPFFGIWVLEKIAFTVIPPDLYSDRESYGIPGREVNVEDYLGFEIEFANDYVRLGERYLLYPNYDYSTNHTRSNLFFFRQENSWVPGYYSSPDELLNEINKYDIGSEHEGSAEVYYSSVRIMYPEYPQLWFHGYFFDPEFSDYLFNPLFQGFIMLDYNHILIGSKELILATRVTK